MKNRAYSLLDVKSVDSDKRIITGIATTPETDRMGDIVNPLGAKFAPEIPLLWQHEHGKPVGTAVFGKATKKGIPFTATLPVIEDAGPLKDLVDMAWQAVKARLVKGVSIGFSAIKYSFMDNGGIEFDETEIYELSLVTIPANASATIQSIKAFDARQRAALGLTQSGAVRLLKSPGATGIRLNAHPGAVKLLKEIK